MSEVNQKLEEAKKLSEKRKFTESLEILNQLTDLKFNKNQKFEYHLLLGINKMNLNQYDEAKNDLNESYDISLANKNLYQQTQALHQLGIITKLFGDYPKAIGLFREELRRCSSLIPSYYSDLSYNFYEQGDVMMLAGNYEDAEMYFNHAFTFASTELNYHGVGLAMAALANINLLQNSKDHVVEYMEKSIENFKLAEAYEEAQTIEEKLNKFKAEEGLNN